jgi:PAS domain S-box-containing protein
MKPPSKPDDTGSSLRDKIIGLGERSIRKSYYPQLRQQLEEAEKSRGQVEEKSAALLNMLEDLEQARSSLADSQARYRALVENINDVIFSLDLKGTVTYISPVIQNFGGLKPEQVVGVPFREFVHPDDRSAVATAFERVLAGHREPQEFRVIGKEGALYHVRTSSRPLVEEGRVAGLTGVISDISERKAAEKELHELNNDFVTLLESTGDFVYFKDRDNRFRFCSQTMANITGHRSWRDMIGKDDFEVFPEETARIYREEEQPIFNEGKALLNKVDPYFDTQGERRWVNTNKWPVFDDNGAVVGIFGISRDVTELKVAEEKLNELNRDLERRVSERTTQLEAANKELEAFAYSVSHDLRTPLRAIDGFSHILLEDFAGKLDDEGKRLLNVVRDNTNRMGQLIDDILKFSRSGRMEITLSEIDMEKMARAVFKELQSSVAESKLQLEIESLPPARGDSAMLRQVFVNLLSNAIKFSRNNATPKIHVGASVKDNETIYYVQDNGAGFDMQFANKLFGVFQRLHSASEFEGTGIGLAIVKRIVTRHGGRVWAEGKVNEGATIYFSVPSLNIFIKKDGGE